MQDIGANDDDTNINSLLDIQIVFFSPICNSPRKLNKTGSFFTIVS